MEKLIVRLFRFWFDAVDDDVHDDNNGRARGEDEEQTAKRSVVADVFHFDSVFLFSSSSFSVESSRLLEGTER